MLKAVPKGLPNGRTNMRYNMRADPRFNFFLEAKNQGKEYYYYRLLDGIDKLQPLGLFKQSIMYGTNNVRYQFENTINDVPEVENIDNLYYSDEPLSDSDLDYNNNPDVKSIINGYGGRKTKRYRKPRKSRKSKKSRKYYK